MKTASDFLKDKHGVPIVTAEKTEAVSQSGLENGGDQNIRPNSNSCEPDNGKSKKRALHNEEVYRSDEDDSQKMRKNKT